MSYRFFHMLVANSQDFRILPKKKEKKNRCFTNVRQYNYKTKKRKKKETEDKMNEESLCIKRSFSKRKNKRRDKFVLSNSCKGIYRYIYIYVYIIAFSVIYFQNDCQSCFYFIYVYIILIGVCHDIQEIICINININERNYTIYRFSTYIIY